MSDASLALQAAVYGAIASSAAVQGFLGTPARLFDAAPGDSARPYAVVGGWTSADVGGDDLALCEHRFTLLISSAYRGVGEVKAVAAAIEAALQTMTPPIGHHIVLLAAGEARFTFDASTQLSSGLLRWRALTHPA